MTVMERDTTGVQASREAGAKDILAGSSLIGAVLASSCCILPLALVLLGVSGAWIGNLTALAPYQPIFLLATFALLGAGFWQVYRRPNVVCADGSYCARPVSGRITKGVLWIATALVLAALAVNFIVPLFS